MTSNTETVTLSSVPVWSPDDHHHTLSSPEFAARLHAMDTAADPPHDVASGMPDDDHEGGGKGSRRSSFEPDNARGSEPSPDVNLDFASTEDVSGAVVVGLGEGEYLHPLAVAETAPGRVHLPPPQSQDPMGSVRSRGRVPAPLEVLPFGEGHTQHGSNRERRPPHSSYYNGPPPLDSAYGSDPVGQIGIHYPREILRIERDYSGGELVQFHPTFPLELEGRVTPVQHQESMNQINEILISAHRLFPSFVHNAVGILTLYISTLFIPSHYDREMQRLRLLIDQLNREIYNPQGLNILWPQRSAFLFLEIEYY